MSRHACACAACAACALRADQRDIHSATRQYDKDAAKAAFDTLAASGLTFIDSAEVYGFGLSEEFTGEFVSAPEMDIAARLRVLTCA